MKRVYTVLVALVCVSVLTIGGTPAPLSAANQNVGYVDFAFGSAPGADVTADKPQSKLWYNDGRWWAVMFHAGSGTWHIYKLNWPSQWVDTGTVVDSRPTSRADALWDDSAKKLSIASLVRFNSSNQGLFSRFSYDSASKTYSLDGPAKVMMTGSAETLALDKDSTGQFWITFTQSVKVDNVTAYRVLVNRTIDSNLNWGTPFVVPGPAGATKLAADDISSLVAYTDQDGSSIGVLWSNHNSPSTMYFTHHRDSDDDTTWPSTVETIYTAACAADDHINLKSLQSDPSGAIYAAVKTSFGDSGCGSTSSDPLLRLVVRKPDNTWKVATFGTVSEAHTRPQVLLDTTNHKVYMFATAPTSCGVIYMKSASMDNPSFPSGKGTPFISSSTYTCLNNVTSTKQTVNSATGLVVMASDESKLFYMHNAIDLGAPPSDTNPPTVTGKTPAANATNVGTGTSVTATFSEAVTGVSSTSFTLTPANGSAVAATVTYDAASKTATLTPAAALTANTSYTAALTPAIVDAANNPLAATSWSFTTAAPPPPDTTAPTVNTRSPAANATGVGSGTSVTATFSEAVSGVSGSTFTLSGPNGAVAASVSYNPNTTTATLQPTAALAANTTYIASLTAGIADAAGNPLAPLSWSFTTASAPPPSSTRIKDITFESGSLVNPTNGVDSVVGTVTVETAAPLKGGTSASINNSNGSLREDFTAVDELYVSFYLKVNALNPSARLAMISNGSTNVGVLYLTSTGALQLRNGSTTIATGAQTLTPGVVYRVGLHQKKGSGSNAVLEAYLAVGDAAFTTPFVASTSQSFTTQATRVSLGATNSALVNVVVDDIQLDTAAFASSGPPPADTTAPTVTGQTPAANATGVGSGTSVTATFSEAVSGVSGSTFTLSGPNGVVAASVSYNAGTTTATLQPSAALDPNTTYSANLLAGIADAANNPLAATSWSFTTAAPPPPDTTAPTVNTRSPAANATGVGSGTSVTATFSEAVTGVSGSTFTLSGPNGAVAASVSYNPNTTTATLQPTAALAANTTYTASLTAGIADAAGNPLAPLSWSFTTASAPPPSSTRIKDITFESGSLVNPTNGVDSVVGTVTVETAAPLKGGTSASINNSNGSLREDFTAVDELYVSFYLKVNALNPSARLAMISNGSTNVGVLYLTSTGALQLRNGSTTIATGAQTLTPGVVYRVGLHQKKGSGSNAVLEAYLAVGDAAFTTPFVASTSQSFTTQATRVSLGATNSALVNVVVDDIQLDTAAFASPAQ